MEKRKQVQVQRMGRLSSESLHRSIVRKLMIRLKSGCFSDRKDIDELKNVTITNDNTNIFPLVFGMQS